MTDRDRQSLLDIIHCADLVRQYLDGKTFSDLEDSTILQDAIVRRLEIVGEASRRLSDEARCEMNHINWSRVIGMRNIMIHQYEQIDLETVWDTATQTLPRLIEQITPYLDLT
jgi:uncharacterized protein with HEPN domain